MLATHEAEQRSVRDCLNGIQPKFYQQFSWQSLEPFKTQQK